MQLNKTAFLTFVKNNRKSILIIIAVFISQSIYLIASNSRYQLGFPLDDAWIHQTYARNFAHTLRWEYIPGRVSGGSTSPLWTLLLSPGFLFGEKFYLFWTYFLSTIFFAGSALIFEKILRLHEIYQPKFPYAGLLFALEWHFVWAAGSGMETILFIFIILLFCYFILKKPTSFLNAIICIALIIWIRPDGITLLGPWFLLVFIAYYRKENNNKLFAFGLSILITSIILYALFNFQITGTFLPNTFYAKQAEYAVLFQTPLLTRYITLLIIPVTGVGILLIPGFVEQLMAVVKRKYFAKIGLILWFFGYILIYAFRLPVIYQHGRYIIPAIPVFLVFGLLGYFELKGNTSKISVNLLGKVWNISLVLTLFIFLFLGADAYSADVAIIESEMVKTAKWINLNSSPNAIIGAHDIGALGFFGNRDIIDLAGLITPDVISYIREEEKLAMYLDKENVDLVMTFPNWYMNLVKNKKIIYTTDSPFSPEFGGENMAVYSWKD